MNWAIDFTTEFSKGAKVWMKKVELSVVPPFYPYLS